MSATRIKICGITDLADGRYAAGAGADFLGFVMHPGSPRVVSPERARDIIEWIHGPQSVGVFVNVQPDEVNRMAETAGFDFVQLHGVEDAEACARIERPVIKALHVGHETTAGDLAQAATAYDPVADYLLLDTRTKDAWGGTGRSFDWRVAERLDRPVFLAGGLNPTNVAAALRMVNPFAVDVSSGVEEAPGRKDFDLIDAFVEAVRGA